MSEAIGGIAAKEPEVGGLGLRICPRLLRKFLRRFRRLSRRIQRIFILAAFCFLLLLGGFVWVESKTSLVQSWYLARLVSELGFSLQPGPSARILFPEVGPYDIRLGYARIPQVEKTMVERGFRITSQSVMSERMFDLAKQGVFPTYQSKTRAGLVLNDRNSQVMYSVLRPERLYPNFDSIPGPVLDALLFIENKEVLEDKYPFKNPAIEWDRFFRASVENLYQIVNPDHSAPGGSTIATQLEKYRHSQDGRTHSVGDKLRQMLSASLRAYYEGRDTRDTRKKIVHTYMNSIPLAAFPGYGEVNGVGDGLWAWFATDFDSCNRTLVALDPKSENVSEEAALCYRKVLSLFVAHRRPSYYLLRGRQDLGNLVNSYLRLMVRDKTISVALGDAALKARIFYRGGVIEPPVSSFVDRKAVNAIRKGLSSLLAVPKMYDLDQMDLSVRSTIDKTAHDEVTRILQRLNNPEYAKEMGLMQSRLLIRGDPAKVTYSMTLFERTKNANLLRIQTDNFDGPFDINSGTRLDLGSTAKLRTLVTYLEIVEGLYGHLAPLTPKGREESRSRKIDPIGNWAIDLFNSSPKITLEEFLAAAMARTYSANPGETFFTGGGVHTFGNFKKEDNGRIATVAEALRESINLPFVRLMRDIVRFYAARLTAQPGRMQMSLNTREEEELRQVYLRKFADKEGSEFLTTFYMQYRGLKAGEYSERLFSKIKPVAARQAAAYRLIYPDRDRAQFAQFMRADSRFHLFDSLDLEELYQKYAPDKFDLNDRGYIIKLHPLELWLVSYLEQHPDATLKEIIESSKAERQLIYKWLFKPSKRRAQDVRIKQLLEQDAFLPIFSSWQKTGYPFAAMVPSLASAIGSSGDRPSALAELMGIILNDGVRLPRSSIDRLHFGAETPYETVFEREPIEIEDRIFSLEVAKTLRAALVDVVENGTARRLKGSIKLSDGSVAVVGGKTGTGDHQFKQFGPGGVLLSSRVISRTATFVFFIGDNFFGAVSAHVRGEQAGEYEFTSALASEVLKAVAPALQPLLVARQVSAAQKPDSFYSAST